MKTVDSMKGCLVIFSLCFFFVGTGCETKKTTLVKEDKNSPCSLLSREEVEAVVKQKLEEPKRDDILCIYQTVQKSPAYFSLVVQLNPAEPAMFMQSRKDFMKGPNPFKSVEGVGDNAYFYNEVLNILAKKHALSLSFNGIKLAEDDVIRLAKKAVEKIK